MKIQLAVEKAETTEPELKKELKRGSMKEKWGLTLVYRWYLLLIVDTIQSILIFDCLIQNTSHSMLIYDWLAGLTRAGYVWVLRRCQCSVLLPRLVLLWETLWSPSMIGTLRLWTIFRFEISINWWWYHTVWVGCDKCVPGSRVLSDHWLEQDQHWS